MKIIFSLILWLNHLIFYYLNLCFIKKFKTLLCEHLDMKQVFHAQYKLPLLLILLFMCKKILFGNFIILSFANDYKSQNNIILLACFSICHMYIVILHVNDCSKHKILLRCETYTFLAWPCQFVQQILFNMIFVFTEVAYSITEGHSSFRSCSSGKFLTFSSAEYYAGSCRWGATRKMNDNCNYPTSCTVHASNSWLDNDPCVGSVKTLTWGESCTGNNSIFVYALLSNCNALLY